METKTLHSKLLEIMKEVGYLQKDGTNDFHHYNYVTERKVSEVFRNALASRSILFLTSVEDHSHDGQLSTVATRHQFIDVESGETLEFCSAGEGYDKGDKGVYKAITGATKYALVKFFLLPTGDDPEADMHTDIDAAMGRIAEPQEDPTGDGDIPVYAEAREIVVSMKGKQGVKELKQFFGHCAVLQWDWPKVLEFAKSQGVDLLNGLSKAYCVKLRDMVKQQREVGVT